MAVYAHLLPPNPLKSFGKKECHCAVFVQRLMFTDVILISYCTTLPHYSQCACERLLQQIQQSVVHWLSGRIVCHVLTILLTSLVTLQCKREYRRYRRKKQNIVPDHDRVESDYTVRQKLYHSLSLTTDFYFTLWTLYILTKTALIQLSALFMKIRHSILFSLNSWLPVTSLR